jgi:hypothetical protein
MQAGGPEYRSLGRRAALALAATVDADPGTAGKLTRAGDARTPYVPLSAQTHSRRTAKVQVSEPSSLDAVIVAIGFDGRWFEALLGEDAGGRYRDALGGGELESVIDVDLSVAGLAPPLHLPVMAGLAQGPGFPNLSCLGLLSDRILRRYVAVNDAGALVPESREHA